MLSAIRKRLALLRSRMGGANEEVVCGSFMEDLRGVSKAQLRQDLWVLYETGAMDGGAFVEFGATDGRSINNTLLLEEYGWRGVLSEPNPAWHAALALNRPLARIDRRCVWNATGERMTFRATEMAELGGLESTLPQDGNTRNRSAYLPIEVETVTLADLLVHHGSPSAIDFLSIDTEGSELAILSEFFHVSRPYSFGLIAVEHNHTPAKAALHELLTSHGYELRFPNLSRWDSWYRRVR